MEKNMARENKGDMDMKQPRLPKGYRCDCATPDCDAVCNHGIEHKYNYWVCKSFCQKVNKFTKCMPIPPISPLQREYDRTTMASRMLRATSFKHYHEKYGYQWDALMCQSAIELAIKELEEK